MQRPSDISTKYTNPTSIPREADVIITSDSPMNNVLNLINNPNIKVIDVESLPSDQNDEIDEDDLVTYSDLISPTDTDYGFIPENLSYTGNSILDAPSNLNVSSNSFQIESNSSVNGDGTITYSATLTFDDIPGATDYEYIINASL